MASALGPCTWGRLVGRQQQQLLLRWLQGCAALARQVESANRCLAAPRVRPPAHPCRRQRRRAGCEPYRGRRHRLRACWAGWVAAPRAACLRCLQGPGAGGLGAAMTGPHLAAPPPGPPHQPGRCPSSASSELKGGRSSLQPCKLPGPALGTAAAQGPGPRAAAAGRLPPCRGRGRPPGSTHMHPQAHMRAASAHTHACRTKRTHTSLLNALMGGQRSCRPAHEEGPPPRLPHGRSGLSPHTSRTSQPAAPALIAAPTLHPPLCTHHPLSGVGRLPPIAGGPSANLPHAMPAPCTVLPVSFTRDLIAILLWPLFLTLWVCNCYRYKDGSGCSVGARQREDDAAGGATWAAAWCVGHAWRAAVLGGWAAGARRCGGGSTAWGPGLVYE